MWASWVTYPTVSSSDCRVTSRTSWPPTRTAPDSASYSRATRWVTVVLPAPDGPTRAIICPGSAVNEMSRSTWPLSRDSVRATDSSEASEISSARG